MKKKILVLLLALTLLLTACGQGKKIMYVGDNPNVALIIAKRGDMGFNDSAVVGLNTAEHDLGAVTSLVEHQNKKEDFEKIFLDTAKGYQHIIIMSSMMKEPLEKHAAEFPDTKFLMYDGEIDWSKGNFENVSCVIYRANESSYLAGYLAAAITETGKIGFIGGINNQNIQDFAVGFIAGARHRNPDIEILLDYAGSFADSEKGKTIAQTMVDDDVDIIFAPAGGTATGVLEVLAENDRWMIGVDTDQYASYFASGQENLANQIVTSATKDISGVIYRTIENYTKLQVETGLTKTLGLKEGGVSLAKNDRYQAIVPQAVQDDLDQIEQQIISGELEVPSARTLTPEEVQTIIESVKPE